MLKYNAMHFIEYLIYDNSYMCRRISKCIDGCVIMFRSKCEMVIICMWTCVCLFRMIWFYRCAHCTVFFSLLFFLLQCDSCLFQIICPFTTLIHCFIYFLCFVRHFLSLEACVFSLWNDWIFHNKFSSKAQHLPSRQCIS